MSETCPDYIAIAANLKNKLNIKKSNKVLIYYEDSYKKLRNQSFKINSLNSTCHILHLNLLLELAEGGA
jgi:hypothetical protein